MKQHVSVVLLFGTVLISPTQTKAVTSVPIPCGLVLNSVNNGYSNAKGVALVYKVKLTPSFPRTSISVHAIHLPDPLTLGYYDSYEGFAFIPDAISWRFKLYPTKEEYSPTWAGRFDDITAELEKCYYTSASF
jgi:hypothetical protein